MTSEQLSSIRSWVGSILENLDQSAPVSSNEIAFEIADLGRVVTSICIDESATKRVRQKWEEQRKERIVSAGYRVLEDFWNQPFLHSKPYYSELCKEYLKLLNAGNTASALSPEILKLNNALQEKQLAANEGIVMELELEPSLQSDGSLAPIFVIRPGPAVTHLPTGKAIVEIEPVGEGEPLLRNSTSLQQVAIPLSNLIVDREMKRLRVPIPNDFESSKTESGKRSG